VERGAQTVWLAALSIGVLAGILGLILPVAGLGLGVAATLLVLLRGPRLVGLGGVWLGFGGLWSALLIRAGIECATGPAPSDGCSSPMFQAYLVVGLLMAVLGLVVSVVAFRSRRTA
jgi:hypothetical protein